MDDRAEHFECFGVAGAVATGVAELVQNEQVELAALGLPGNPRKQFLSCLQVRDDFATGQLRNPFKLLPDCCFAAGARHSKRCRSRTKRSITSWRNSLVPSTVIWSLSSMRPSW